MTKKRTKKKGFEPYKSWDEYYFAAYCIELMREGLVRACEYEPYPFILTEGLTNKYTVEEKLKTKSKFVDKEQIVLRPSLYTPDFLVFWGEGVRNKLFQVLNEGKEIVTPFIAHCEDEGSYSIIEVKPNFDRHGSTRLFINNQKSVWDKYEKFVNLTKIEELFKASFVPAAYLKTPSGAKRTPKWKTKTLKSFLK